MLLLCTEGHMHVALRIVLVMLCGVHSIALPFRLTDMESSMRR